MDEFFSWQMLATFAGATAATGILTQFLKNLIPRMPKHNGSATYWHWCFCARQRRQSETLQTGHPGQILPMNAALVSMASNGAFAAVKRAAEGKGKTE